MVGGWGGTVVAGAWQHSLELGVVVQHSKIARPALRVRATDARDLPGGRVAEGFWHGAGWRR